MLKPVTFSFLLLLTMQCFSFAQGKEKTGEYYQITIYHFSTDEQQSAIDNYLKNAYLPALHRQKINNVGVFTDLKNDTSADKRIFVFLPVKSLQQIDDLVTMIEKDREYLTNGKDYLETSFDKPLYSRLENIILKSFPLAPSMQLPKLTAPSSERVYELRSYESSSEHLFLNKRKMFNEGGEIGIFKKLNFNAVFFSTVIAGNHMPNLMYMTTFENMADRDAHWKSFVADAEWKTLSALPEYQHNVSHADIYFLRPTSYSDF